MEYKEIVAVTGLGGLYQLLATKSDGAIVRNLADQTTRFISARLHNVTPLESIEVYTTGDNVRLHHVFQKMKEQEAAIPPVDGKQADNGAIKNYFKSIFPEFDEERVYVSDMKKMLKWYEVLKANDLLHFEEAQQEAAPADGEEKQPAAKKGKAAKQAAEPAEAAPEAVPQPVKKARAKKAADTDTGKTEDAAAPAKKAAPKKKKAAPADETAKPAKKTAAKKK